MAYTPGPTPANIEALLTWLDVELKKVSEATINAAPNALYLVPQGRPPDKPRQGQVAYAVPPWDPGGGSGVYYFNGSTWNKMG